ncbi:MAG TPA: endonuclease/exonuclease/phosphatase family protein [Cyclobacteriaceae bacterium]
MKISFSTLLVLFYLVGYPQEKSNPIIKVLSFNILHGATTKGDFNLDAIAKVILDTDPDLVAMQEVDFMTKRAKRYDLGTELGWRTKLAPIFAKAMKYDGGEYGEAVLSRYSFIGTRNIPLPHSPENEPRAALEVLVALPGGDTVAFIGTHLDHTKNEKDRIAQTKEINRIFKSNKYPTILAGDLNAEPGSAPIDILESLWTPSYDKSKIAFTFPSGKPIKKIDYVMYLPGLRWRVIKSEVINDPIASDHCAYVVTLELLPTKR